MAINKFPPKPPKFTVRDNRLMIRPDSTYNIICRPTNKTFQFYVIRGAKTVFTSGHFTNMLDCVLSALSTYNENYANK